MLQVYKNIKNFLTVAHIRQSLSIYCYRIISYRAIQYFRAKAHEIFSSHSLEGNFKVTRTVLYMNKNMLIIRTDFLYDYFEFLIRVNRLQKRYRSLKRHKIITDVILIRYYKETTYIIPFRTKKLHYFLLKSLGSFGKLLTSKQRKAWKHTEFLIYSWLSQQHLKIITQDAPSEFIQEFEK